MKDGMVLVEFTRQTARHESAEIRVPGTRERMRPDSVARWIKRKAVRVVEEQPEPEKPETSEAAPRRRGRPRKTRG